MKIGRISGTRTTLKAAFACGAVALVAAVAGGVAPSSLAADAADAIAAAAPAIGQTMPDGKTVYAGIAPDTNKPFYTTPEDETAAQSAWPLNHNLGAYNWEDGKARCESRGKGWGLPTGAQLNHLYNHRAAIGGFDVSGSFPAGYYWSSSEYTNLNSWGQRFSDGTQIYSNKEVRLSGRCVLN